MRRQARAGSRQRDHRRLILALGFSIFVDLGAQLHSLGLGRRVGAGSRRLDGPVRGRARVVELTGGSPGVSELEPGRGALVLLAGAVEAFLAS
ncbi:hypothetical protein G6O69_05870 [Pseudenhygromyxa sp. WMMC2535]|uniref:hypothetical protein n=1 Tax=Pseudenhygromyxa sp. WMMC2535 TaxID=2712867 RepID=UPI001555A7AA|nr:hypothetical protein [Pseudenhygromyxa sp. WMMC2535]NVB37350.1 hypothetical protein [Pseudenhygromyxa sp. WMMC2535]